MFQVTITQRNAESRLEENLNLRPTKLRPAVARKGLKTFFFFANAFSKFKIFSDNLRKVRLIKTSTLFLCLKKAVIMNNDRIRSSHYFVN